MKKIKLVKTEVKSLSEIFQTLDIKFAWVNKKFEEVSTPAKCRDFLGDCIWSKKTGKASSIYGFKYNYKESPFDGCRFSLKFPDDTSKANFIKNLSYLHEREKQAGVKLTKVFETQELNTLVIKGSNTWANATWKISLYTFYLKVMSYASPEHVKDPESGYIGYLSNGKEATLLSKVKRLKKEHIPSDIGSAHNYMGFVSLIKGINYCDEIVLNHKLVFGKA